MNISNIAIRNFKSLRNIKINLKNLTLFTGINSSGKSSVIEVLFLFIQANKKIIDIENIIKLKYEEANNEDIVLTCNDMSLRFSENNKCIPQLSESEKQLVKELE